VPGSHPQYCQTQLWYQSHQLCSQVGWAIAGKGLLTIAIAAIMAATARSTMVRLTIRYLLLLALRSYLPHHGSFLTSSLSFKIKELAPPGEYVSDKRVTCTKAIVSGRIIGRRMHKL
jgi:hypothetical protein